MGNNPIQRLEGQHGDDPTKRNSYTHRHVSNTPPNPHPTFRNPDTTPSTNPKRQSNAAVPPTLPVRSHPRVRHPLPLHPIAPLKSPRPNAGPTPGSNLLHDRHRRYSIPAALPDPFLQHAPGLPGSRDNIYPNVRPGRQRGGMCTFRTIVEYAQAGPQACSHVRTSPASGSFPNAVQSLRDGDASRPSEYSRRVSKYQFRHDCRPSSHHTDVLANAVWGTRFTRRCG